MRQPEFLPMTKAEMERLGWSELDVLLVSGDAYIDHPSFASALLGRFLVKFGYRVGLICQPRWDGCGDLLVMGRPRLAVGIGGGALDSMLAHYTAFRKKRHDDAFTPGGKCGARPNRAVIVYTNLVRQAFPGLPVIIGGIEASLRRYAHYDFWSDSLRRSVLLDSKADCLIYGMGEYALLEAVRRIERCSEQNRPVYFDGIRGTVRAAAAEEAEKLDNPIVLPALEDIEKEPALLVKASLEAERHIQEGRSPCVQRFGKRCIIAEPPVPTLQTAQMDLIYDLPFTRKAHPSYKESVPALEMIKNSLNSHRGCGGGCSFCSLALHQGRPIASRSEESILKELEIMTGDPAFKGSVSDVGGPTANMWQAFCQGRPEACRRSSCLFPQICPNFKADQDKYAALLRKVAKHPKVKHVRVASGVRFDLALQNDRACRIYVSEFTGGQLKIAPEHCSEKVLKLMRKPKIEVMERFVEYFLRYSEQARKEQYIVPYLMSAFPGCTEEDMRQLSAWLKKRRWSPQQVQCFIPTPGTVATAMYYAETDTEGKKIFVAKTDAERMRQHYILLGEAEKRREGERSRQSASAAGPRRSEAPVRQKHSPSRADAATRQKRPQAQTSAPGRSLRTGAASGAKPNYGAPKRRR